MFSVVCVPIWMRHRRGYGGPGDGSYVYKGTKLRVVV